MRLGKLVRGALICAACALAVLVLSLGGGL